MDRQKDERIIKQGPIKHKDTTIRFSLVSVPQQSSLRMIYYNNFMGGANIQSLHSLHPIDVFSHACRYSETFHFYFAWVLFVIRS